MSAVETAQTAAAPAKPTSSLYMIALLGIVSTFCGLVIVLAYQVTMPAIKRNLAQITRDAVFEILPEAHAMAAYGVQPSGDLVNLEGIETNLPRVFAGYDKAGDLAGVVFEAAGRGYADVIRVLYAYAPEREAIVGFKVLDSKETPGLGDQIGKNEAFLANFQTLDVTLNADKSALVHGIEAVKHGTKSEPWQIDALSGATVSSKAVGALLNHSAQEMIPLAVRHLAQLEERN